MIPDLTVCVLAAGGASCLTRTMSSLAEAGLPSVVVAPEAEGTDLTRLDPPAAFELARSRAGTDWCLLLTAGETVRVLDEASLLRQLSGPGPLAVVEVAGASLLADPCRPAVRLVRRGTALPAWDAGDLWSAAPAGGGGAAAGPPVPVVVSGGAAPFLPGTAGNRWLRGVVDARARARTGPAEIGETVLEAAALAQAGEPDGALLRAQRVLGAHGVPDGVLELAARVCLVAALCTGRTVTGLAAARAWAERTGSPVALGWWGLLAGLAGEVRASVAHQGELARRPQALEGDGAGERWLPAVGFGLARGLADRTSLSLDEALAQPDGLVGPTARSTVELWHELGRDPAALVARWPDEARPALAAVVEEGPGGDLPVWLALAAAFADAHGLTVRLSRQLGPLALQLTPEQAQAWTRRLRAAGSKASLLLLQAQSAQVPPSQRVLAAGLLLQQAQDVADGQAGTADALLREAAAAVPLPELRALLVRLDELAPAGLPAAVQGAAATQGRAVAVAALLEEFGAAEQAAVLRASAGALPTG